MTRLLRPHGIATIDTTEVTIAGGSTKLDSATVPYASATLELPLLEDSLLEWLDPRDGVRVTYQFGDDVGGTRDSDLGLRARSVDHQAKTVTLELASDEAVLQDFATLVTDTGARVHEASARAVCNYVLGKIGAALEAGADDANLTAYWALSNQIANPSMEVNAAGWLAGTGAGSLSRIALTAIPAVQGGFGLTWLTTIAGDSNVAPAPNSSSYRVQVGRSYVWSFYLYSGTPTSTRAVIQWFTQSGVYIGSSFGTVVVTSTTAFKRVSVIGVAPPNAVTAYPYVNTTGNPAAGWGHVLDAAMFYEGDEVVPYFDGSTPDSATYTYDFQGTAHASPSTRTPSLQRDPGMFVWKPGVTAWQFLTAILSAAGLVLWCDELRRWYLAFPENRTIIELVSVTEGTTSTGTDTLSRDDAETFVTGVVVHYTWRDDSGGSEENWDSAGTQGKVLVVELNRPYPGPGAAAAILARRQGTGRRQTITTILPVSTTPGMTAQISLPGAPDTVGRVAAVTFDHATGFTDLDATGLVDIMPGSIAALLGTIDSLVGTIDSL